MIEWDRLITLAIAIVGGAILKMGESIHEKKQRNYSKKDAKKIKSNNFTGSNEII